MKPRVHLLIYKPHEMASVNYEREEIFLGNFHDFYPGCHGTEFNVGNKTVEIPEFDGPEDFANKLAAALDTVVVKRNVNYPLT